MSSLQQVSSIKTFGGHVQRFSHVSQVLQCTMHFSVFVPPQAKDRKVPVVWWLSGLTCTDENFIQKAGAQRVAAALGLFLVTPDTSPRGVKIEGDEDSWDFGTGAGFYVNATESKWATNYRMYDYVTKELPELIQSNFPVLSDRQSISGHSMGGHGALICALKNPGQYRSVSAFAPISNPINCPWGQKAFTGYLGSNHEDWKAYDATELTKTYEGPGLHIFIDQGTEDKFYKEKQLLVENLRDASKQPVELRLQDGYDHSYFFVSSFIEDHLKHHASFLN